MTIIMAIKRDDQVWIGSDRRISYGDGYKQDCPENLDSKIVCLDYAVIGAAGDVTLRNYMELFASKGDVRETPFDDKLQVIEFFINFKKFLKRHAGLGESELNRVQNLYGSQWIITTKTQIFEMDEDGGIIESSSIGVIGSGSTTARAILDYMLEHQPKLSTETMLQRAHKMAVKHNLTCGGKQVQVNVTELLLKPILPSK